MDAFSNKLLQTAIQFQMQPLINPFWWKTLAKNMYLDGVMREIMRLGAEYNPLHAGPLSHEERSG